MEYTDQKWDGFLLIDKESGITSYDVIRRVKPFVPKGTKIGHAGTLDPFASGLLVLLLGKYTKRSSEFLEKNKVYRFELTFGYSTDTLDPTGEILEEKPSSMVNEKSINESILNFLGEQLQTPPQFSAKKVSGRPSYKYAREGKKVELQPKRINIEKLHLLSYKSKKALFEAEVSSGTYIRTLGYDIAVSMGSVGTVTQLERISIGEHSIKSAVRSADIQNITIDQLVK